MPLRLSLCFLKHRGHRRVTPDYVHRSCSADGMEHNAMQKRFRLAAGINAA
jgi:hypothetical protein